MDSKTAILLVILIAAVLSGALRVMDSQDMAQRCCTECTTAFSHSPVSAGPEGVSCTHFNGGGTSEEYLLSKDCAEYFQETPAMVSDCFSKNQNKLCGPESMGAKYDPSYCDNSCAEDTDCVFSCGCGAIYKNEVCHDEAVIYDCVDHEVTCEAGKCVAGSEKIPSVVINTDKTEYAEGEYIEISAINGLDLPILYHGGERFWGIEYFENNAWKNPDYEADGGFQLADGNLNDVCYIKLYERGLPEKLEPYAGISHSWNQKICPYGGEEPEVVKYIGAGRYRLTFYYGFETSGEDPFKIADSKTSYSNEFTISESVS